MLQVHQHLNLDSKEAPLSEPQTLQEAQQKNPNDPETDLCVCAFTRVSGGVGNNRLMWSHFQFACIVEYEGLSVKDYSKGDSRHSLYFHLLRMIHHCLVICT